METEVSINHPLLFARCRAGRWKRKRRGDENFSFSSDSSPASLLRKRKKKRGGKEEREHNGKVRTGKKVSPDAEEEEKVGPRRVTNWVWLERKKKRGFFLFPA